MTNEFTEQKQYYSIGKNIELKNVIAKYSYIEEPNPTWGTRSITVDLKNCSEKDAFLKSIEEAMEGLTKAYKNEHGRSSGECKYPLKEALRFNDKDNKGDFIEFRLNRKYEDKDEVILCMPTQFDSEGKKVKIFGDDKVNVIFNMYRKYDFKNKVPRIVFELLSVELVELSEAGKKRLAGGGNFKKDTVKVEGNFGFGSFTTDKEIPVPSSDEGNDLVESDDLIDDDDLVD